jgi:curved DNA-binding protein CbpA
LATHYETLGVSPNAEPEVVQGAYRALMRKYHPDANGGAASDDRAKCINVAYATLSDPGLRADYDARLRDGDVPPRRESARPDPTPNGPAEDIASTHPFRKAQVKIPGMSWRLTALVTIGLAAAGFATGRILSSTPSHPSGAVSDLSAPPEQMRVAPVRAKTRPAVPARDVADIVSHDIVPRWRPDCAAAAGPVDVDVQVNLAPDGSLLGTRVAGGDGDPRQLASAAESARRAVRQAAPFALSRESYDQWRVFIVRFDTRDVCR